MAGVVVGVGLIGAAHLDQLLLLFQVPTYSYCSVQFFCIVLRQYVSRFCVPSVCFKLLPATSTSWLYI